MTDEAKRVAKELHDEGCKGCIHMKIGRCGHIMMGLFCRTKLHDAANMIESLSAELEQSQSMLETRTRERDAAIAIMAEHPSCETCKHYTPGYFCMGCRRGDKWEWRGVKED